MVLKYLSIFTTLLLIISVVQAKESIGVLLDKLEKGIDVQTGLNSIDTYLKLQDINIEMVEEDHEFDESIQNLFYFKILYYLKSIEEKKNVFQAKEISQCKRIITLSDGFSTEDHDFDELSEKFERLYDEWAKRVNKSFFYLRLDYLTWNYVLKLTDSTGEEASLYSKERGWCLGGGLKIENGYWGGGTNICFAYMTATVGENSKSIKYNQHHVAVNGVIIRPNIFWRPKKLVALKFSVPIVYHHGDYNPPAGGQITDDNEFSYGYTLGGEWRFNNQFHLEIELGKLKNFPSSMWIIGLEYIF